MKKKKELIFYSALVLTGILSIGLLAKSKNFSFINADPNNHQIIINADNPLVADDMGGNYHSGKKVISTVGGSTREFEFRQATKIGTRTELYTNYDYYAAYISNTEQIGSLQSLKISNIQFEVGDSYSSPSLNIHWGWNYFEASAFQSLSFENPDIYPGFEKLDLTDGIINHTFTFNNELPSYFYLSVGLEDTTISFSQLEITFKDNYGGCEPSPEVVPQVVDDYFIYKAVTGGVEVYGLKGGVSLRDLTIPNYTSGGSVIGINRRAFRENTFIRTVNLPSSLQYVDGFEGCTSLMEIEIPSSVKTIKSSAFYNCIALETLTLHSGLEYIYDNAFDGCISLSAVNIPNTVKQIRTSSFGRCRNLTSIHIPASVTSVFDGAFSYNSLTSITVDAANANYNDGNGSNVIVENSTNKLVAGCVNSIIPSNVLTIGQSAFSGITNLTTLTLPSNLKSIESSSFQDCTSLTSLDIPASVAGFNTSSFLGCTSLTTINIPEGISFLASDIFKDCTSLTSITIPESMKYITYRAFENTALTSLHIPKNVQFISADTFRGTSNTLTSITVDSLNQHFDSRNNCNAIMRKSNNELVLGCKNTTVPYNTAIIGESAFEGCSGLTDFWLPGNITKISKAAFKDCTSLNEFPYSGYALTEIEEEAFSGCTGFPTLELNEGLATLGAKAFYKCTSVTSLSLPSTLTNIEPDSFLGVAKSLTSIEVDPGNPAIDSRNNCNAVIFRTPEFDYLGLACINTVIPNDVYVINDMAYAYVQFTSFEIPAHINQIGKSVFAHCDNLTTLTVALSNPVYDSRDNCNGVIRTANNELVATCKTTVIPNSVTNIAVGALAGTSRTTFNIPMGIAYIPNMCYANSPNLNAVTIPNSVAYIGFNAFLNCTSLTSIVIPSSVDTMQNEVFSGCSNLETIYLEHSQKPAGWHIEWQQFCEHASLKWYSDTPIYDGNHWHYVGGVPTIWVI